ncbi:hypothetical protein TNCV_4967411 [Trichonephila clavipes]|nr:hypothetical protein TNCV_4967411 [Trichonephila clavipes]
MSSRLVPMKTLRVENADALEVCRGQVILPLVWKLEEGLWYERNGLPSCCKTRETLLQNPLTAAAKARTLVL